MTIFKNKKNDRWYAKINDTLFNVFISKDVTIEKKTAKNDQQYAVVNVEFKRGKDNFYYFLVK